VLPDDRLVRQHFLTLGLSRCTGDIKGTMAFGKPGFIYDVAMPGLVLGATFNVK
jgi:hypothetical protein